MKKALLFSLCTLLIAGVFSQVVGYITNTINAESALMEPIGEEVIDFETSPFHEGYVYAITKGKQVYQCVNVNQCQLISADSNGKPIRNVKKVAVYGAGFYSGSVLSAMILLENDEVYLQATASSLPVLINTGVSNIIDIACDRDNQYIVTANGDVYARGDNSGGQLGVGSDIESSDSFVKVNIDNVKKISAYGKHVVALKNDGTVYAWGVSVFDGVTTHANVAEPIPLLDEDGSQLNNASDISKHLGENFFGVAVLVNENNNVKGYMYGNRDNPNKLTVGINLNNISESSSISYHYNFNFIEQMGIHVDDDIYSMKYPSGVLNTLLTAADKESVGKLKKAEVSATNGGASGYYFITETGAFCYIYETSKGVVTQIQVGDALKVKAYKSPDNVYISEEKYNGNVDIETSTTEPAPITCKVQTLWGLRKHPVLIFKIIKYL